MFVGEIKKLDHGGLEVTGFHNWIQLYLSEKAGNLDYKGYFKWGTVSMNMIALFNSISCTHSSSSLFNEVLLGYGLVLFSQPWVNLQKYYMQKQ